MWLLRGSGSKAVLGWKACLGPSCLPDGQPYSPWGRPSHRDVAGAPPSEEDAGALWAAHGSEQGQGPAGLVLSTSPQGLGRDGDWHHLLTLPGLATAKQGGGEGGRRRSDL